MSTPSSVPADLQTRMATLFGRMLARGMGEVVSVYGRVTVRDPANRAVARQRVLLGAFTAYVASGGGASTTATEGQRESGTLDCYFPLAGLCADGATTIDSLLNPATTGDRWLVRTGLGHRAYWRITDYQRVGPYAWVSLSEGGTTDGAGTTK